MKDDSGVSGAAIGEAISAFRPLLNYLIREAEGTGASGEEKHAAVADGAEWLWTYLGQTGAVKELKGIPWELVAPIIVPAGAGLISLVVGMWNRLMGKVWSLFGGDTDG